jgi:hypothetical protein
MRHDRSMTRWASIGSAILLAAAGRASTSDTASWIQRVFHPSARERAALARGAPLAFTLAGASNRDIGVAGVVRAATTPAGLVDRVRDIANFKRSADVLQIGTFGSAPQLSDVAVLKWDRDDLDALRDCRVGNCDLQLTAATIEHMRREVDWQAPDAGKRASGIMNRMLVDVAGAYLQTGSRSLEPYRDNRQATDPREEFRRAVTQSPSSLDLVPEFRRYLIEFPGAAPDRVENLMYWSKEKIASHAVTSVNHVAIYWPSARSCLPVVIGSKQVYATRYITASVAITTLFPVEGDRFDLVYVNRSRTDALDGFFARLLRPIVQSRVRAAMSKYLLDLKSKLEGAR